jgi:hypothetical protein
MLHPTTLTPPPNRSRFAGSWRGDFCGQWMLIIWGCSAALRGLLANAASST